MQEVTAIKHNGNTIWEKGTPIASPFSVVNNVYAGANTCTLTKNGSAPDINMEYSFNNSTWTTWAADANGVRTISIPQNGRLFLRGDNPNGFNPAHNDTDYYSFTCSQNYALAGNINSLFSKYETDKVPTSCFRRFFAGSTTLKVANYMRMPATKPGQWAYLHMFKGCTGLTKPPIELPATNLVNDNNSDGRCYGYMFYGCSSMTTMPIIRATGFGFQSCYDMFRGCSSLVNQYSSTDPTVSTTTNISFTIADDNGKKDSNGNSDTFYEMFRGCTSLVNASGITATKTTEWKGRLFGGMFNGCTALTSTPTITIGSLTSGTGAHCNSMFRDCTSLTTVNMQLNATTLYTAAYKVMFYGCTSLVNAPEIKATSISGESGNNGALADMFNRCSKLNTIKVHFTSWNSGNYTQNWTYGTKSTGTFYKPSSLPSTKNTSGNTTNPHYIPYNWTITNI